MSVLEHRRHRRLENAALDLAALGYGVFPCKPRGKTPLIARAAGGQGFKDATRDERTILRWWDRCPDANIGLACQQFTVLDIDSKHGADPREVIPELGLDRYPMVLTGVAADPDDTHPNSLPGVRGAQVYFKGTHPTGDTSLQGCELRGRGAYVMGAGSVHPCGVPYEGNVPPVANLEPMPASLLAILPAEKKTITAAPAEQWLSMLRDGVPAGDRNKNLARITGHLLRRYIDVDLAAELVHLVNAHRCKPPLPADEVDRIIESIASSELRRREQL